MELCLLELPEGGLLGWVAQLKSFFLHIFQFLKRACFGSWSGALPWIPSPVHVCRAMLFITKGFWFPDSRVAFPVKSRNLESKKAKEKKLAMFFWL